MDGIGVVTTSSPGTPSREEPDSSSAATSTPSIRTGISPARTGLSGEAPTKAEQMSVPPDAEPNSTVGETCS